MTRLGYLFSSSIGRKLLMAVTGVILIGFAFVHLAGNLLVFDDPDVINGYAHFLHALGPVLWIARIVLLGSVIIHVWAACALALENVRARGSQPLRATWLQATIPSRTMHLTGAVVLAFLIYHLAHFTFGSAQSASFKDSLAPHTMRTDFHLFGFLAVREGERVANVHAMIVRGFRSPVVSAFYMVAIGFLSLHLLHGIESSFQTFGMGYASWQQRVRISALVLCLAYFLGNALIPGAVLFGAL